MPDHRNIKMGYVQNFRRTRGLVSVRGFWRRLEWDHAAWQRAWRISHPERIKEFEHQKWVKHQDTIRIRKLHWWRSEKGKMCSQRKHNMRRTLPTPTIILNKCFEGAELHHTGTYIEENAVGIWVPAKLQDQHPHCLRTGRGMDEMNKFAMEFVSNA